MLTTIYSEGLITPRMARLIRRERGTGFVRFPGRGDVTSKDVEKRVGLIFSGKTNLAFTAL